jgi:hypothetical protein
MHPFWNGSNPTILHTFSQVYQRYTTVAATWQQDAVRLQTRTYQLLVDLFSIYFGYLEANGQGRY